MTLKNQRGGFVGEDEAMDRFPLGMRVLAVDDDPTCLKVLENLLRKCQYQVTTTNQAIKALKMLRENRNKYDLVISDVNMPDMDGFKLLELVGLEMDLPVIMLSGHSDTKLVMKGITHGACDYLLKPVRIEELKNIWQHVLRRRTFESNDEKKLSNQEQACRGTRESGKCAMSSSNLDQNGKVNKKRKDKYEDDEEESDDSGHDNEDSSSQKKPRVVWSVELHRKFVAAVNQLGLDKAVPKKILDMMNVEGLTRENVASHLQKYRLYLRRISNVATQQANMVAAFGGKDSSYINIGLVDGFGDLHNIPGSGRLGNTALSSYAHGGLIGRLNSSAGLTVQGITSSGFNQPGHPQNLSSNSFDSLAKFLCPVPVSQSASLFQGIPTSVDKNHLQETKCTIPFGEFNPFIDPTGFTGSASFPDARVTIGSSSNSVSCASSNPFLLQGNPQPTLGVSSSNPESFGGTSNFLDQNRCETWQGAVHQEQLHSNNIDISNASPQILHGLSATRASLSSFEDSRDAQCQEGLLRNVVQTTNYTQNHSWEQPKQDYNHNLNQSFSATNSVVPADSILDSLNQTLDQSSAVFHKKISSSYIEHYSGGTASIFQPSEVGRPAIDTMMKPNEDYLAKHSVSLGGFRQNSCGSFDDIISALIRREQNETTLTEGEFGFDGYSLGSSSCI